MQADFINYQGSKLSIIDFIVNGITGELNGTNKKVLDLFSGSGVVSSHLSNKFNVISNDIEPYAAIISKAIATKKRLCEAQINDIINTALSYKKQLILDENIENEVSKETNYILYKELDSICDLYFNFETIWNSKKLTPDILKRMNRCNLFTRYYSGAYYGISQSLEIDSLIFSIRQNDYGCKELLYACLFYAMKESSFSRDGHMAQPLNFLKNAKRGFATRSKSIISLFNKKLFSYISKRSTINNNKEYVVYNENFKMILSNEHIMNDVDLVYADPPYTDMQYSRYYHLLNVAVQYDFPEPTINKNGFTTGLYTEGRFQSALSQKGKARKQLLYLINQVKKYNKTLALSYAYPENIVNQKISRYTVSIEDLIDMCKNVFGSNNIKVNQINYSHANHKNSKAKKVIEYLILCTCENLEFLKIDINEIKQGLNDIVPTNKNPIYNTNLYWSQKAFNVTDYLINKLTNKGDIVFDPFLGSGVTVLESISNNNNRAAVGCDVNEMPLFITKTLLTDALNEETLSELKQFRLKLSSLNHYYEVQCNVCKNQATIDKVVFDKPIRNVNKIKINSINIKCSCGNKILNDTIGMRDKMYKSYSYEYVDPHYKLLKNSKIAVIDNDKISNIFTDRNLKVLDEVLSIAHEFSISLQNIIKYIINSALHQCKITDLHSNSQWPLWIPKRNCVEKNIVLLMDKKIHNFLKATKVLKKNYSANSLVSSFNMVTANKAMLLQMGSQFITNNDIPDNSIDLIITDPPYLEQVLYSEYMQLYKPIVDFSYNLNDEIIVSSAINRDKSKQQYFNDLEKVFVMCGAKLKKNHFLCLYFHDSDLSVWYQLIKSLYNSGFVFMGQSHIKRNITLKNIISPKKSLNGDSILFFCNTKLKNSYHNGKETLEEIEINIIKEAKHMLSTRGSLSTPELYDNGLMEILINNGWINALSKKHKSLVSLFEKKFLWNKDTAKWDNE